MQKEFVTERLKLIDLYPDKARKVAKEYGLKEDEVELIRKGRVSSEPVIDRDARTVVNYISTDAIDRDNEVIEHRGVVLDDYKKNPIVPWAHDYRALPIGKNLWIKSDKKGLVAKTYFLKHPFAEEVYNLYTEDIEKTGPALKAWSVGFIPLKWKDHKNGDGDKETSDINERPEGARRTYKKWLLLEYSAVPVPSNPEALTLMVEKGLIKDDKLKKDIEDFIVEIEKAQYKCECIECGWKHTSDKHCNTYKCEKCGGTMRRVGRPGPGQGGKEEVTEEMKEAMIELVGDEIAKQAITKPEETDDMIRLPVKGEEGKHKNHKIRWITVSEEKGIKGLYCIDCKKIITYIFLKSKGWDMAKAKKWMKDHGKHVDDLIDIWNDNMPDEKDEYLKELFEWYLEGKPKKKEEEEANEEPIVAGIVRTEFTEEVEERFAEMEQSIAQLKEGRVLSGKNLKLVKDCREQIDKVGELLDKLIMASEPPESPKEESILPLIEDNPKDDGNNDKNSIDNLTVKDLPIITEEILKQIREGLLGQRQEIQKIFDKSRGKVS